MNPRVKAGIEIINVRLDGKLKEELERLIKDYDSFMSVNNGILKLITKAVEDWQIPGYVQKPKPSNEASVGATLKVSSVKLGGGAGTKNIGK